MARVWVAFSLVVQIEIVVVWVCNSILCLLLSMQVCTTYILVLFQFQINSIKHCGIRTGITFSQSCLCMHLHE